MPLVDVVFPDWDVLEFMLIKSMEDELRSEVRRLLRSFLLLDCDEADPDELFDVEPVEAGPEEDEIWLLDEGEQAKTAA